MLPDSENREMVKVVCSVPADLQEPLSLLVAYLRRAQLIPEGRESGTKKCLGVF